MIDPDLHEVLDRLETKLDRLLDPETGIYARLAEHEAKDDTRSKVTYLLLVLALAAGAPGLAKILLEALG